MKKITLLVAALMATMMSFAASISEVLAAGNALDNGRQTTERYEVTGEVAFVNINTSYGNADIVIKEGSDMLYCWRTFDIDSVKFTDPNKVKVGDQITVYGAIKRYDELDPSKFGYAEYDNKIEMSYGYLVGNGGEGEGEGEGEGGEEKVTEFTVNGGLAIYYPDFSEEGAYNFEIHLMNMKEDESYAAPYLILDSYAATDKSIAGTFSTANNTIDLEFSGAYLTNEEANDDAAAAHELTAAELSLAAIMFDEKSGMYAYTVEATFTSEGNDYHVTGIAPIVSIKTTFDGEDNETQEPYTLEEVIATAIRTLEIDTTVFAENGRIYCDEAARIYNVNGLDVTRMNGNLQGVFIVKNGNKLAKVVVK